MALDTGLSSSMEGLQLQGPGILSLSTDLRNTVEELIRRCKALDEEVETYIAAVEAHNKSIFKFHNTVDHRSLRNNFKTELRFLKKLETMNVSEEKARQYIASSNLLNYEALWDTAKRSSGLLAFRKLFLWNQKAEPHQAAYKGLSIRNYNRVKGRKSMALVDVVAEDGMEWIRVSTISEKRLIFELAKLGWQNESEDSDEEMAGAGQSSWQDDEDDDDEVEIVRNARELARAARANTMRGRPPKVRFVLTRIEAGKTKEVDNVLSKMRETGATVQCADELPPPPALSDVLPRLLIDRSRTLSHVVNIDCTILLALISDISHCQCPVMDWYPGEVSIPSRDQQLLAEQTWDDAVERHPVRAQIREEAEEKLLPTHLYPTIGSRPMVCVEEAAAQMGTIVETIATDTEKIRSQILLARGKYQGAAPDELMKAWINLSEHPVTDGFRLPIRVVPSQIDTARLPKVAESIAKTLSPLNVATFFYGWQHGFTTLSSNRVRARQIDQMINEHGLEEGEAGPHMWLCGESRSLVAKHGRRA